jgi:hypothetical protein
LVQSIFRFFYVVLVRSKKPPGPQTSGIPVSEHPILIVGAGLSGLCCARNLSEAGVPVRVFEAADRVGGRIKTDVLDGFLLDRGFQVLLTAYPEAKAVLDYEALELGRFEPGALIRFDGALHRLVDPWRRPRHGLTTALSPAGGIGDKLRMATVRRQVAAGALSELYKHPEATTIKHLQQCGFSERIIRRFFRPFLGGIFLDSELKTSSRMFEFVFRMFSQGDAALPAGGMEEIPRQLAAGLPADCVTTEAKVDQIGRQHLLLESGQRIEGAAVVVATEAPEANRLCGDDFPRSANAVTCLYFAADRPPIDEAILVLNGEGRGPINNLCVPSNVCPGYAPAGAALVWCRCSASRRSATTCFSGAFANNSRLGMAGRYPIGSCCGSTAFLLRCRIRPRLLFLPCRNRSRRATACLSAATTARPRRSRVRWPAADAPPRPCSPALQSKPGVQSQRLVRTHFEVSHRRQRRAVASTHSGGWPG